MPSPKSKKHHLPERLFVRREQDTDDVYYVPTEKVGDHAEKGIKHLVGLYTLQGVYEVEADFTATQV